MRDDLKCPYCGTYREQPDDTYEQETIHEAECACGKIFGFTVDYIPTFDEFKLPCANGEPHVWVEMCGAPAEFFRDKVECSYCGERSTIKKVEEGLT